MLAFWVFFVCRDDQWSFSWAKFLAIMSTPNTTFWTLKSSLKSLFSYFTNFHRIFHTSWIILMSSRLLVWLDTMSNSHDSLQENFWQILRVWFLFWTIRTYLERLDFFFWWFFFYLLIVQVYAREHGTSSVSWTTCASPASLNYVWFLFWASSVSFFTCFIFFWLLMSQPCFFYRNCAIWSICVICFWAFPCLSWLTNQPNNVVIDT